MYEYAPFLQKTYTKIFRGFAKFFHETLRMSPNQVSIVSFVLCLIGLGYFYIQAPTIGLIITLLALFLDGIDGTIARVYNMKTKTGHIFETVFDGLHEFLLYPVLAAAGYVRWELAIAASAVFLVLRIWKYKNVSIFDGGFKRFGILFGYFLGFEFVLSITLAWTTFAIFVNILTIIDDSFEKRREAKA